MKLLRRSLKNWIVTPNTIRYRVEFRCLANCLAAVVRAAPREGVLLDVGAGSGEMSLRLLEMGFCSKLIGVEPGPGNFEILKRNWRGVSGCRTFRVKANCLPIEAESVDIVMSSQVLEHIEDDVSVAREMARVLRYGGHALISVPHPPEIFPDPDHIRPGYTEAELLGLFTPLGLRLRHTEYFFTLPTLRRFVALSELPMLKLFLPVGWVDREADLSVEERRDLQPYGIACVFEKVP